MSVKAMAAVWDMDLEPCLKYVLLAYADHADHAGKSMYPSVALVAHKTGYGIRHIQRLTRQLEDMGLLVLEGKGPHGTRRWSLGTVQNDSQVGDSRVVIKRLPSRRNTTPRPPEPSVTIKEPKHIAASKDGRLPDGLFDAITKTTQTDPKTAGASIGKVAQALSKAGYLAKDVEAFQKWWWGDKKMRQRPPTLWQLKEQIGVVRQTKTLTQPDEPHEYFIPPNMRPK